MGHPVPYWTGAAMYRGPITKIRRTASGIDRYMDHIGGAIELNHNHNRADISEGPFDLEIQSPLGPKSPETPKKASNNPRNFNLEAWKSKSKIFCGNINPQFFSKRAGKP